ALIRWAAATASARALPLGVFVATLGVVGPDPARLVRQATDALLAGAGRAGVIVGVDDAHLLDELPAMLVHVPARFIGWNRHGPRVWFSSCQVRVADPGAEFVFDVSALGFPVAR
nr:hypothetical protein [Actinomycetota bacterium]